MKKLIFLLSLVMSVNVSAATFSFNVSNESITSNNSFLDLGVIDIRGCSSPGLIDLSGLKEGSQNATCIENRSPGLVSVTLLIPIKISLTTDTNMLVALDVPASVNNFTPINVFKTRNNQKGGSLDMIDIDSVMVNNEVISAELEVTATIVGPGAKSSYESYVTFIVGPNL